MQIGSNWPIEVHGEDEKVAEKHIPHNILNIPITLHIRGSMENGTRQILSRLESIWSAFSFKKIVFEVILVLDTMASKEP